MDRKLKNGGRVSLVIRVGGAAGGLLFAAAGAWMGSMNAGWFDLPRDSNALFPLLGLGLALVVVAWAAAGWPAKLWRAGLTGRGAVALLLASPAVYILSWVIEFAIFGTLALGLGLILLAVVLWRRHLSDWVDRVLVALAAVGSLIWNTETVSASYSSAWGSSSSSSPSGYGISTGSIKSPMSRDDPADPTWKTSNRCGRGRRGTIVHGSMWAPRPPGDVISGGRRLVRSLAIAPAGGDFGQLDEQDDVSVNCRDCP